MRLKGSPCGSLLFVGSLGGMWRVEYPEGMVEGIVGIPWGKRGDGIPDSLDLSMIGSGGSGEAPFDSSRRETSCWFGGQGGEERDKE
ncbi:hypothetical protein CK203_061911 [Vitis vinifera]|uniref:Uncharacterized protein n=1 Tax=Vitis vinifera TaxID=29760 RepID=A0A438GCI4_VITVI|nr:hypothetical protein CK203_061911 [Vitis vinifera]